MVEHQDVAIEVWRWSLEVVGALFVCGGDGSSVRFEVEARFLVR